MTMESVTMNLAALARSLRAQAPVVEGPQPNEGFQNIKGHAEAIKDMLDVAAMVERFASTPKPSLTAASAPP
jgi:hypothetical protein